MLDATDVKAAAPDPPVGVIVLGFGAGRRLAAGDPPVGVIVLGFGAGRRLAAGGEAAPLRAEHQAILLRLQTLPRVGCRQVRSRPVRARWRSAATGTQKRAGQDLYLQPHLKWHTTECHVFADNVKALHYICHNCHTPHCMMRGAGHQYLRFADDLDVWGARTAAVIGAHKLTFDIMRNTDLDFSTERII